MKAIRDLLIILLFSFAYTHSTATHLRAGDITVARVGCTNQYIITLHVYTRVSPSVTVKFGGGTLDFGDGSASYITKPVLNPNVIAEVDNGGVGEVTYPVTHTYPGSGTFTITYYEQDRNAGVLNMDNSVGTPFFIQSQIVIDPLLCDNSPILQVPPINEGCTGVTWLHNPGAYDQDGDSLSYELFVPKQAPGVDVTGYADQIPENFTTP